jgi:hypothetical protein
MVKLRVALCCLLLAPFGCDEDDEGPGTPGSEAGAPDAGPPGLLDAAAGTANVSVDFPSCGGASCADAGPELPAEDGAVPGPATITDVELPYPAGGTIAHAGLAIDRANGKLIVVTNTAYHDAMTTPPRFVRTTALWRCNLDGSACSYANPGLDSYATQMMPYGSPSGPIQLTVDDAGGRLLLSSFSCALDGSDCRPGFEGPEERVADPVNRKLLYLENMREQLVEGSVLHRLLWRCEYDGTGCTSVDITPRNAAVVGHPAASMLVDSVGQHLYLLSNAVSELSRTSAQRCTLDGASCIDTTFPLYEAFQPQLPPSTLLLDRTGQKLLAVTAHESPLQLVRSNLDLSAPTLRDLSRANGVAASFRQPSCFEGRYAQACTRHAAFDPRLDTALVDVTRNQLVVVSRALIRCQLDGTGCSALDLTEGGARAMPFSVALFDDTSGRLFVASADANGKPTLLVINQP